MDQVRVLLATGLTPRQATLSAYKSLDRTILSAGLDGTTSLIIGAAIEVHRHLGPGLLERTYRECLSEELRLRGLHFQREVAIPVAYKGRVVACGYRLDLLIEDAIPVELKCVESVLPVHECQLLTYLRLLDKRVGLLINFNVPVLVKGIRRVVNGL